jgi:hypothetical protein
LPSIVVAASTGPPPLPPAASLTSLSLMP